MKRVYLTTILTALLILAVFAALFYSSGVSIRRDVLKVGFIYKNDESIPYTYNFTQAQHELKTALGDRVEIFARRNVSEADTLEPIQELVRAGCSIIFTNNNSPHIAEAAWMYPEVQFCQGAYTEGTHTNDPENYHSFGGRIYEGRYITGVAAGLKLQEMIDEKAITPSDALVGFVAAYPVPEVISGYTAFLLGVRSVVPEATMRVRYTNTWSSYSKEKETAAALIEEGCLVISQHTDTIGPAVACEEAAASRKLIYIGYHENMIDIAPATALTSTRVNWVPYVIGAVQAVLDGREIEKAVPGSVHGNDLCAGFDHGWVEVLELNKQLAAKGTQELLDRTIEGLKKGTVEVFKGDYTGVNPNDSSDTIDLRQGFRENEKTSWPTFCYVLQDVVTVE